jgi:uncharacterized protein (DUF58 family)
VTRRSFEFDGVVRLTRMGAGYLLFTVLIGFAALNTGNNSLYITLSAMLATLLLSGIMSKEGLRRIEVEIVQMGEAWAGLKVPATLRIKNRSRIWIVRDLVLIGGPIDSPIVVAAIDRRSSVEVRADLRFPRRGRVSLDRIDLYTRFPFGLFMKKKRARLTGEALVYPELLPKSSFGTSFAIVTGEERPSGQAGRGHDILAFREYVRGDELRHVHWKKSAMTGRWIMKQPEAEANPQVIVSFDPWIPPGSSDEQFERLVSEATTYIRDALEGGWSVRLHLERQVVQATPVERRRVFEALAIVEPTVEASVPHRGQGVALFTLRGATGEARTA